MSRPKSATDVCDDLDALMLNLREDSQFLNWELLDAEEERRRQDNVIEPEEEEEAPPPLPSEPGKSTGSIQYLRGL